MIEKKKKVLIVISSLKVGGGAERVASTLGTWLNNRGYDVCFMTFYKHKNNYNFKGKQICLNEDFRENNISKGLKLFLRAKKISSFCDENKVDTCISFMEAANFPTVVSKFLFRNKSKIIVSLHNNLEDLLKDKFNKFLIKFLYPKSDLIVAVSKHLGYKLKKLNLKNVKIIYNLNNLKEFIQSSKIKIEDKNFIKNNDGFKFINIGRLVDQKNQKVLIRAFSKIDVKNKKLYILGEGNKKEELEFLIQKLNLKNQVFLLGNIKNVYPYLKNCDCFVLSSKYEGFGLTIVEALTFNKPVISTDCEVGPREILTLNTSFHQKIKYPFYGKYGVLVNNNFDTEKELILIMEKVAKESKFRRKYSNGFKRAEDFDVNVLIKEWEKII